MSLLIDATDVTVDQAILDAFYPEWLKPLGLLGYWEHCGPLSTQNDRWRLNRVNKQLATVTGTVTRSETTGMRTTGHTGGIDTLLGGLEQMTLVSVSRVNTPQLYSIASPAPTSNTAAAMLVGNFQTALGGVLLSEEGTASFPSASNTQLRAGGRFGTSMVKPGIPRAATLFRVKVARISSTDVKTTDFFNGSVTRATGTDAQSRPRSLNTADTLKIGMAAEAGWNAEADHLSTMILAGAVSDAIEASIYALYQRIIPLRVPGLVI